MVTLRGKYISGHYLSVGGSGREDVREGNGLSTPVGLRPWVVQVAFPLCEPVEVMCLQCSSSPATHPKPEPDVARPSHLHSWTIPNQCPTALSFVVREIQEEEDDHARDHLVFQWKENAPRMGTKVGEVVCIILGFDGRDREQWLHAHRASDERREVELMGDLGLDVAL